MDTATHLLFSPLPLSRLLGHPPYPSPLPLPSSLGAACVSSDKGTATVALPLATGSRKCWFPMQPLWANFALGPLGSSSRARMNTIPCMHVKLGYTHRNALCVCHLCADNDSTISLLPGGDHGKPPGKQLSLWLFDPRVGLQVRGWLANYSSNHSKCFVIALSGHTGWGWRCWA